MSDDSAGTCTTCGGSGCGETVLVDGGRDIDQLPCGACNGTGDADYWHDYDEKYLRLALPSASQSR